MEACSTRPGGGCGDEQAPCEVPRIHHVPELCFLLKNPFINNLDK